MYVILHMSVITQNGGSPLIWAAEWGRTGAITQLVNAGANLDLQNKVCQYTHCKKYMYIVHEYAIRIVS